MTACPVCGNQVPEGEFCAACGAHLPSGSATRHGAFAADPVQHLLQPNLVSTLFPHLPHHRSMPFRLALLGVTALLLFMGALRLTGPAIAVAAAGVPVLYAIYLYEIETHRVRSLTLIALVFGVGLILGVPWGIFTGPVVTRTLLETAVGGAPAGVVLGAGVFLPLVAQLLMLAGALLVFVLDRARRPVDGFAFGAASALGFTLAVTLVNLAPEMQRGLVEPGPVLANLLAVLGRGLLVPVLNAATTGLIAAAVWLLRTLRRRLPLSWTVSLPAAVLVAAAVRVALGLIDVLVVRAGVAAAIDVVIAAALLLWLRLALHTLLLSERPDPTIGPSMPCLNCRHVVPRMAFCPHCGIATAATPSIRPGAHLEPAPAGRPYRIATSAEIRALHGPRRRVVHWTLAGGIVAVGAVALGIVASAQAPGQPSACGRRCAPPPPPCLGTSCPRLAAAPPLQSHSRYTSTAYGYSVDYTDLSPSNQSDRSVAWDLSVGNGSYTVQVTAANADGRSPQHILDDVVANNFGDYSLVYTIPGAEVGYTPGAGAVYDNEVTPLFGSASHTRLAILTGVKHGLAIVAVGSGDASSSQSEHADPSDLPISNFLDTVTAGTRWPGDPPR